MSIFSMCKFVIPFYYLTYSRLKSIPEKLSLIWIYPLFLVVFLFGFYQVDTMPHLFLILLAFVAWMSMYEIGYLENDAMTIKKESNPNLRIPLQDINFIEINFGKIVLIRLLIFMGSTSIFFFFNVWSTKQIIWFVLIVLLVRLFFYKHNRIRSRWNILSYFFLCVCKYWVFPIIYLGFEYGLEPYWIILICFPILRTIEHAVKPKYKIQWLKKWVGSLDNFRVKYYAIFLVMASLYSFGFSMTPIFFYSIAYYFLFRTGVWFLIRSGRFSRESLT